VLVKNSATVLAILEEIHRLGVSVTLDDFGAESSSLNHLRTFRLDKIKVDRRFIADLTADNAAARAIMRAVAGLGADLGIETVAEGVETEAQLRHVRAEGVSEIQGFCSRDRCRPSSFGTCLQSEGEACPPLRDMRIVPS
jgi:predicted signal transduction protein with EAL and GGDEF domain